MYVVLMYDIKMDGKGPKVRKKIFDLCKSYLHHIQFSVFEGQINNSELFKLENQIRKIAREKDDSVIIFTSIFDKPMNKIIIGNQEDQTSNIL